MKHRVWEKISIAFLPLFLSIKILYAQSCTGEKLCCLQVPEDCICIHNVTKEETGYSCSGLADKDKCGPADIGTCNCTEWCDAKRGTTVPCSGGSCTATCPAGYVTYSTSCYGEPTTAPPSSQHCTVYLLCPRSGAEW